MHLAPVYYTTTNYKNRKNRKLTDNQMKKLETEWRQYNKRMRKMNCHSAQFDNLDDYIAYTQGKYKPTIKGSNETLKVKESYRRETPYIPSSNNVAGNAPKKESQVYSGERQLLGIATMHKSNMVPIFADNKEEAKEIASMRR
jgi:hypothetical protein